MCEVTVVIPVYNGEAHVGDAVRSALAQSFGDLEILVVDDGSTDSSSTVVSTFEDARVRLIRQANAGPGAARNAAIDVASGCWIAFLDADDLWHPQRLERQLAALDRNSDVVWAAAEFDRRESSGAWNPRGQVPEELFETEEVIGDALSALAMAGMPWTSTVLVRRDVVVAHDGFDAALRVGQDRDLWVRLAADHPRLVYLREPLATKRQVAESVTQKKRQSGSSTTEKRARAWHELGRSLPPERREWLDRLVRRVLVATGRRYLAAGQARRARAAFGLLAELGLSSAPVVLRILSMAPGPIVRIAWRVRSMIG